MWLLSEKKEDASMFTLSEILSKISTQASNNNNAPQKSAQCVDPMPSSLHQR